MPNDDLDLSVGRDLVMRHRDTLETADFHILEVFEYRGQIVVFGENRQHGIRVGRGRVVAPARPSCWAYIRSENPSRVVELSLLLGGAPLVVLQNVQTGLINAGQTSVPLETRAHPILQAGAMPGLPPGYPVVKDKGAMQFKARRLVDVYWDWREKNHYGRVPAWVNVGPGSQN